MAKHPRIAAIVSDAEIMSGRPCLSGTRIPVDVILSLLAQDWSPARVVQSYPQLTLEDVSVALRYAAEALAAPRVAAE